MGYAFKNNMLFNIENETHNYLKELQFTNRIQLT